MLMSTAMDAQEKKNVDGNEHMERRHHVNTRCNVLYMRTSSKARLFLKQRLIYLNTGMHFYKIC